MRRQASSPSAKEAKPYADRLSAVGAGAARSRASVMTPEGALAADEELVEIGPAGRPRRLPTGVDHPPVSQRHLEADDHVLDLSVPGGELAGGPTGQPATDR